MIMKSETSIYTGFEFEVEGYHASAIINTDLKEVAKKGAYTYSVFILIVPDSVDEKGHPTEEEFDYLNTLEKAIIHYLEEQTQSVHVGHTTLYRAREIIFYTKDKEVVETFLEHYLSKIERESEFEILSDPAWDHVSAFYQMV